MLELLQKVSRHPNLKIKNIENTVKPRSSSRFPFDDECSRYEDNVTLGKIIGETRA